MGVGTSLTLRPAVPMGFVTGVPYVCALGVARQLGARLSWPHGVVSAEGETLVYVDARAGYDDGGVFVRCDLTWGAEKDLDADSLERAAAMRARGWESGSPRTRYRPERFRARDAAAVAGVAVLLALSAAGAWAACSSWEFYPRMSGLAPWWSYLPFALLALLPALAELAARGAERGGAG